MLDRNRNVILINQVIAVLLLTILNLATVTPDAFTKEIVNKSIDLFREAIVFSK